MCRIPVLIVAAGLAASAVGAQTPSDSAASKSALLTLDQKAVLEFAFLEVLAQLGDNRPDCYGLPNLERYVEAHPELFVQAIA
jgi:hypothetical protein